MRQIVIIGNGISGITAARHIRKMGDDAITVISAETTHFFSRTALMYIYMGHMKYEHTKPYEDWFWEKNNITLVHDYVTLIDAHGKSLTMQKGDKIDYDILIIASGSKPNMFGWPGQDLKGVQGMYSYQDLESMELYTNNIDRAVIVGGGLIGIEMAEMLHSRNIPTTFLVRESSFWNRILPAEESAMVNRQIRLNHIDLRLSTELQEIRGDDQGRVRSVLTNKGEEIPCQFLGLTAGVRPNIDFIKSSDILTDKGVIINAYFETNIPDVYAIGDCAQFDPVIPGRKAIEQVWYTGRMHGEVLAKTICSQRSDYRPGPWFNSAKFFDIEYQVYGEINSYPDPEIGTLYWEHKSGKKSIRFDYEKTSTKLLGINLMGIRFRHEVCDKWLCQGAALKDVMLNLKKANFDPEFNKTYEHEILNVYHQQFPDEHLKASTKRGFLTLFN